MNVTLLKSKIHQARITHAELYYEGSLAIDLDLMEAVGLMPWEKILVVNITNGERIETYAIPGQRGSRIFCLNGAAARRGAAGDQITIMSFAQVSDADAPTHRPRVAVLDKNNHIIEVKQPPSVGEFADS